MAKDTEQRVGGRSWRARHRDSSKEGYIEVQCPACGRRVLMNDLPRSIKVAFLIDCTACYRRSLS
jgi:DNA-directed RNA polymerase subunit RPC12/RpoP